MMRNSTIQWVILVGWAMTIVIELVDARIDKRSYKYRWLAVASASLLMTLAKVFEQRLPPGTRPAMELIVMATLIVWAAPGMARAWRWLRTSRAPKAT